MLAEEDPPSLEKEEEEDGKASDAQPRHLPRETPECKWRIVGRMWPLLLAV